MERLEDSFIPNLKPLFKTIISPFNNTIVVANSIRAKPYKKGRSTASIPKKYLDHIGTKYLWDEKGVLVDAVTKKIIPSNSGKVGKPRVWTVNSQDIYSSRIKEFQKEDYMKKLEAYILPYIEENEFIEETNLEVRLHFYIIDKTNNTTRDNKLLDEDNMCYMWQKAIRDVMKGLIIPDDNQKYIRGSKNEIDYVETEEETRLEISIWKR